jgi:hypothetical protein
MSATRASGSRTAATSMLMPIAQVSTYDISVALTAVPVVGPKG